MTDRPINFRSIEGLRAWMAWWVVLGHALQLAGTPAWLNGFMAKNLLKADVAVHVFVILSGFVITHLLLSRTEPYSTYITRRFFRLAPVYFACCLFALAIAVFYREAYIELPYAETRDMRAEREALTQEHFGWHALAHLTMLHGAVPQSILRFAGTSILAPAWSLSLEWQFYLVAPFLLSLASRGLAWTIAVVGGCSPRGWCPTNFGAISSSSAHFCRSQ